MSKETPKKFRINLIYSLAGTSLTILVITVLLIAGYSYFQSKKTLESLSQEVITNASETIYQKTISYLEPASSITKFNSRVLKSTSISDDNSAVIKELFLNSLKIYPQFTSCFVGYETGDFYMVRRDVNGFIIQRVESEKQLNHITVLDSSLNIKSSQKLSSSYNPTQSDWFQGAVKNKTIYWTDVYTFIKEKAPGITASYAFVDSSGRKGVFAIDMLLSDLISFILKQNISYEGNIVMMDSEKNVIAASGQLSRLRDLYLTKDKVTVNDLNQDFISQAVEQHFNTKEARFKFGFEEKSYIAYFKSIALSFDKGWKILVLVDHNKIFGSVFKTSRNIVVISLLILFAAALIMSYISKLLSQPIQVITDHANKIKSFHLRSKLNIKTFITEIYFLQEAISSMQMGLMSFQKYVPADLVRQLIETNQQASIGAEMKELTIFFSDIHSFTKISDEYSPDELAKYLSEYLEVVTGVIKDYTGTIDKYVGDAVMAFWGAPKDNDKHAICACQSAIKIQQNLIAFNEKIKQFGGSPMRTRVGIHTGGVVVGNVGSSERMNYTVIGQNVNLSSRLESINKRYGTQIIISEDTYQQVKHLCLVKSLDKVIFKDSSRALQLYELVGEVSDTPDSVKKYIKAFEFHKNQYLNQDFNTAKEGFLNLKKEQPDDAVLDYYIDMCDDFINHPPEKDWDFVLNIDVKTDQKKQSLNN